MSDLTTDDKIARLVHLVLEAVDHRLADIRVELQQFDARLAHLEESPARAGQPASDDDRFDRLRTEIDRVRNLVEALAARPASAPSASGTAAPAATPAAFDTSVPSLPSLGTVTAPLLPTEPAFHTEPAFNTGGHPASVDDLVPSSPPTDASELIDLDRLSDLLSARLGQLNLPHPT